MSPVVEPIVATPVLLLVHVPPLTPLVSVPVVPGHMTKGPPMVPAEQLGVIVTTPSPAELQPRVCATLVAIDELV